MIIYKIMVEQYHFIKQLLNQKVRLKQLEMHYLLHNYNIKNKYLKFLVKH